MEILKRFIIGLGAMVMALGSSLSTMDGGATLTFAQIGDIPLMAWLFSFGAFVAGAINGSDIRAPKPAITTTLMVLMVLMIAGCETAQVIRSAPPEARAQNFTEHLADAYGEISTARKLAAYYARSQLSPAQDCQDNYSKVCEQARQVDKATRLAEQQLDRIWDAYQLVNGQLTQCTIEWEGGTFPCETQADQILSGLITLRSTLK